MVPMLARLNSRMVPPTQPTWQAARNPSTTWARAPPPVGAGVRRGSGTVASAAMRNDSPSRRSAVAAEPSPIRPVPIAGPSTSEVCADRASRELAARRRSRSTRSEEHTSELQSHHELVCRLLLEKKKKKKIKKKTKKKKKKNNKTKKKKKKK